MSIVMKRTGRVKLKFRKSTLDWDQDMAQREGQSEHCSTHSFSEIRFSNNELVFRGRPRRKEGKKGGGGGGLEGRGEENGLSFISLVIESMTSEFEQISL
jgi:hypothetical protein